MSLKPPSDVQSNYPVSDSFANPIVQDNLAIQSPIPISSKRSSVIRGKASLGNTELHNQNVTAAAQKSLSSLSSSFEFRKSDSEEKTISTWEVRDQSKKRPLAAQSKTFIPDASGFMLGTSKILSDARGYSQKKQCPDTPARIRGSQSSSRSLPSVYSQASMKRKQILEIIKSADKRGNISFNLEITPRMSKRIVNVESLPSKGRHSLVFKCQDDEGRFWVLKFFNDDIMGSPSKFISSTACQLMRYGQLRNDPILGNHVARHLNFEDHLESTREYLSLPASERYSKFENYVKNSLNSHFVFAEYIPHLFPVDQPKGHDEYKSLDEIKEDRCWGELRELLRAAWDSNIGYDSHLENFRVTDQGQVMQVDLLEIDPMEEDFRAELTSNLLSFTDDPEKIRWIHPSPENIPVNLRP